MSLESEDQCTLKSMLDSKDGSQKQSKITYSRDFLLYFADLDICKRLPAGFDSSILSEFEDASHGMLEYQRGGGGSSQRYSSTPPNRVDTSMSYYRGSHGRWDTGSSGSNDRDCDSLSDRDSTIPDSGRRYVNHPRRTWQHQEHDGLLGSGAFPRQSGYIGSASASRGRGNGHYQLNRSSEPYHPPRFYKGTPHSRHDATDARNDETFGSAACSSEDRAEEERKRRASFELLRKEQKNALQEKQRHPEKQKERTDIDIVALLKNSDDERNLRDKSDDKLEDKGDVASLSQGDSTKHSFSTRTAASRPLVPPGFGSALSEKNVAAKSLAPLPAHEVVNIGHEDTEPKKSKSLVEKQDDEKLSPTCVDSHEQKSESGAVSVPLIDANGKNNMVLTPGAQASETTSGSENAPYNSSNLEYREGWLDVTVENSDTEISRYVCSTTNQDQSSSILEKLFNNAVPVNDMGSPNFMKNNDAKLDGDLGNAQSSRASKFAQWFLDEEVKPIDDGSSSKAKDLLSLIVSHDNGSQISTVSNEKAYDSIPGIPPPENTDVLQNPKMSHMTDVTVGMIESFHHTVKPDLHLGVLTCEDLEQSMLAQVESSGLSLQKTMEGAWDFSNARVEQSKTDVDNHASQHLLSLLQKGTSAKVLTTSSSDLDMGSLDKPHLSISVVEATENVSTAEKTLTLETLFGSAFMNELHSMEAPVSVHRNPTSVVSRTDVSDRHGLPLSISDNNSFHPSLIEHLSNKPRVNDVPQPDNIDGHWLSFNDPRLKGLKLEAGDVFDGRADALLDVRLPEEENLIVSTDSLRHRTSKFLPVSNAHRISTEPLVDVMDKLSLLPILENEKGMTGFEGLPIHPNRIESLESVGAYHHLHGHLHSQFPYQINNVRPPFERLDQHPLRNSGMKFIGQEGIRQDQQHAFPQNIAPHPFHGGGPRFDNVHSAFQHMPEPENFRLPHLQGVPRGMAPPHPFKNVHGYMPDANHITGFPINHQEANFNGSGMRMPGSGIGAVNHPEVLGRLIEMGFRGNQKQTPPIAARHGSGLYSPEFDMAFRYR